ncbi:MAG: hypothetical protein GY903_02645 [Fuerstiella sp.]|nr:hypothetical protein [Fuerstiella sp.]MCP4853376.1 hypothetical protein [Fuerstiella sp.]
MRLDARQTILLTFLLVAAGCGTTQMRTGTEQLLLSDSVDRTVDQLDFAVLAGRKVFLDTTYVKPVKGVMFVNSDYIISALRQKLTTSGCLIQDSKEAADYVLEARVGALGTDSLEVTYGLPASTAISQAASVVSSVPLPAIPEISVGKRNSALSTSKIVVFAYHRETGTPVWQSGSAISKSDAKDTWVMGAGPLQRGSIYDNVRFADLKIPLFRSRRQKRLDARPTPLTMADSHQFTHPAVLEQQLADAHAEAELKVVPASHEEVKEE